MRTRLTADKGTYILVMRCRKSAEIRVGRHLQLRLQPGYYLYVGSAQGPGGISARVTRHRRSNKKLHWHIDYLRRHTALTEAWFETGAQREHEWAQALSAHYPLGLERFGASDCACRSHLFFSRRRPDAAVLNSGSLAVLPFATGAGKSG